MILPLPALPLQIGPPTDFARKISPWFLFILILQAVACVFRVWIFLDIMGGFVMGIQIWLGWYAWKEDMNITFISCFGFLCLLNGVFDAVRFIDYAVKVAQPIFGSNLIYLTLIEIAVPLFSLIGTVMAWLIYRDYERHALPAPVGSDVFQEGTPLINHRANETSPPPRQHAFTGHGQRLGSSPVAR